MKITKDTLKDIELFYHPKQKDGYIEGNELYAYLKENKLLEGCLALEDLEEIQNLGVEEFRKYFNGKFVYAWNSVRHLDSRLHVPFLYADGDRVVLYWAWLGSAWDSYDPALRVASTSSSESKPSLDPLKLSLDEAIIAVKKAGYVVYKVM